MSINIEKLIELNDLVSIYRKRKHTLVLNPADKLQEIDFSDNNIEYDKVEWKIPDELEKLVEELRNNNELSNEDKILSIFENICRTYIYDDNLISYIEKIDDESYTVPDWYGREVDSEWEKNREGHNRRVCYELARYIAKSLTELFRDDDNYQIAIHWNKDHTHYFVGLTCDEYSVTLDADSFYNIKDLTRLKTGLTADGIDILEDKNNRFNDALAKFNSTRSEYAIKKMEDEISEQKEDTQSQQSEELNEEIIFLKKALEILVEKYNMDSQGIFEYLKEIVDIRLGPERRHKVWKKIGGETNESTRHIRCLVINVDNKTYIIDVDKKELRPFSEEEFEEKKTPYIRYNDLSRKGFDYYDGT